jgi:hypothetical protein
MSADFESQLHRTLQEIRRDLPDPQPGPDFWRRVNAQRVRRPWWSGHQVQAVAACLVIVAVVGVVVAALQPSGSGAPAADGALLTPPVFASPTAGDAAAQCETRAAVAPTRTPAPAGDELVVIAVAASDLPDEVPAGSRRIESPAFEAIREVGGCVVAWRLPADEVVPSDVTRVSGAHAKQFTTADAAGRTVVYVVADDGRIYLAVSGDVTAPDLASVLSAAVTPS